jgi:acyl-homoserine-lactone acylase
MQRMFFSDRNDTAEFARDSVVAGCRSSGRPDLAHACDVLAGWDTRANNDSRGEVLWREFWSRLGTPPWTVPFDPATPLDTPAALDGSSTAVLDALSGAVADLQGKGIALDTPLGALQGTNRGSLRIPVPGCTDQEGCFNVLTSDRDDQGRYDPYTGSSFIMTAEFKGRGKPAAQALLSYSQSENPRSKHFADQTKLFSAKRWLPMRFTDRQIRRDPAYSRKVVSGRR